MNLHKKEVLSGIGLAVVMIVAAALIALVLTSHPAPETKWSDEYWNQVHVSEYLAEKTWNGSAHVIRGGLGGVVVSVDGMEYEYKCVGTYNCTEGFVGDMDIITIKVPAGMASTGNGYKINNAVWFNDSRCNESNVETHYESRKVDGQWQITTIMTCLNKTVRIIPV